MDVVGILTDSVDGRKYCNKIKQRLKEEGNETVTNCHQLKMMAVDGKMRFTDVADVEQLFRLIQFIPSPKAEPFKQWLAQLGRERLPKEIIEFLESVIRNNDYICENFVIRNCHGPLS